MRGQPKILLIAVMVLLGALSFAAPAAAAGLTINEDNANPLPIPGITGYATTGSDMAGSLQVTAFFTDGSSEAVPWASIGPGTGQAAGTGWRLTEADDTFGSTGNADVGLWKVSVPGTGVFIDRLLLSGVSPNVPERGVAFDRTRPSFGTGGSFRGRDFEIHTIATIVGLDPGFDDLVVTYRNPLDSTADGPGVVGDLFGQILIDPVRLTGAAGVFYAGNETTFYADTDTIGLFDPDSLRDPRPETPEPGSFTLAAMGAMIAFMRRRRPTPAVMAPGRQHAMRGL